MNASPAEATILLVEDDAELGAQIVQHLERAGHTVTWVRDGDEARSAPAAKMQLVVLDLMLPGTYGLDLLKIYRAQSDVPVMILSAREDASDKVRAFSLGADDYMTKPFWPGELVARVSARLRRPAMGRVDVVRAGSILVDREKRSVHVGDTPVDLTPAEFSLLSLLAKRLGGAVTREALIEEALDPGRDGTRRALDVHVSRLRKKLGEAGSQIETVWGVGYRLTERLDA